MNTLGGIFLVVLVSMGVFPKKTPESQPPSPNQTFQEKRWHSVEIRKEWLPRIDAAVDRYVRTRSRYVAIEKLRPAPSVPARVIFVLHGRESTWRERHLHEGSRLTGKTQYVPKGRPIAPPKNGRAYTFKESAEDALYKLKDMENWDWSNLHDLLQNTEKFNGLGYQKYHKDVWTPYNWSGTTGYSRGKYVADGRFSRLAVDKQIGCAAILMRMQQCGIL